jgi:hypothetical protein
MKKSEKKRFIKQLTGGIAEELISKIDRMPEEWDGLELRQLLADKFASEATYDMGRARRKEYNNTVLINNL